MFYINVLLMAKDASNVPKLRQLLAETARGSREEPGCHRFEVYQSQADESKFLLCEHWESKVAWETHRTAQTFTEVYQPQVLPLVEREPHVCELISPPL